MSESAEQGRRHIDAALESLKPEFPNEGIMVAVQDARGAFRFSSNMNAQTSAALLRHVAQHLDGTCKCS